MHSIGFWNVRGLNDLNKQKVAKWFMHNHGVGLFGLLETKLKPKYNAQYVHMLVHSKTDGKTFYLTVIYAFNVERLGGNTTDVEMEHFQECVSLCCMEDIQATGALFTWYNKHEPTDRVYSRLDRAMGTVESVWKQLYSGTKMFRVVKKLKALKPVLKCLNKTCFYDIENNTNIASTILEKIQQQLIDNPGNIELMQQEIDLANNLKELIVARDSFLSQKAKLQWSIEGDLNTSYFHHAIKKRMMLNKVFQIEDKNGVLCTEGDAIQSAFLDYYQDLLGTNKDTFDVNQHIVRRGHCCTEEHWRVLNKHVSPEEVKQSIFSIPKGKSPGPDGFSSQLYRDA
ncbi:uncharacterized protein LOC141648900 [Silene latifolia]|uniref:uncharacterized protein LOC141648900 n=1 Tax=Silene latifolia TaxID=37657 RepID=UPI003D77E713